MTGESVFLDDVPPARNEVFVDFVGSPVAHGELVSVEFEAARKVSGVLSGTRMQDGAKEYCWPMARTVTEPSGSSALPRLDSTNSPPRCSVVGSTISTRACGMVA